MSQPSVSPSSTTREPRSTLYVLSSAILAALIMGLALFLLVRGFQWRAAFAALRAEPGIEILSVERSGFFKKRLRGLRDPLAPSAESILRKHNIGPRSVELVLSEYHSLNTPYAKEREEAEQARFADFQERVISTIGEFADRAIKQRESDLEAITQMLFEARFPEAMKNVKIEWKDGAWHAKGELYAPEHEQFVKEAPNYLVEGEMNFDQLVDLTTTRTAILREQIESPNLFTVDLDNETVHLDRIIRLVADYDEVCERSGLPKPRLQLELVANDPASMRELFTSIKSTLTAPPHLPPERFLSDLATSGEAGAVPSASLRLIHLPPP